MATKIDTTKNELKKRCFGTNERNDNHLNEFVNFFNHKKV